MTLGVNTGNATAIGFPNYGPASGDPVFDDGIHVFSDFGNTTISVNNAATIIGVGNNGIYADIDDVYGNNTISVENTNQIGNATYRRGLMASTRRLRPMVQGKLTTSAIPQPSLPLTTKSMPSRLLRVTARGDYSSAYASTTVFNNAYFNAGHEGIHAFSKATAYEGYYAHAVTTVTNAGNGTIVSAGDGIHAATVAISYQDDWTAKTIMAAKLSR